MNLAIRPASPSEDRDEMLGLFERNFGDKFEQRFDWYHLLNPEGRCWTWFVYERDSKTVLGTTSLYPRSMYVDGNLKTVGQVMFFAVDAQHRSLGPAVMLQRATFEPVNRGELAFCYDCPPHDEGMSTFARLGMRPSCEMTRYVLPLRSDEYLQKRLGKAAWTRPLVSGANLLLGMRRSNHKLPGLEISRFDGAFGDEFSRLDKLVSSSGVIRACRSAEVLNWLYRQFPLMPKHLPNGDLEAIHVLVARRCGEILAFAVFLTQFDNFISIMDLFGTELESVGRPLIEAIVEIGLRDKMQSVYAYCAKDGQLSRILGSAGLRPRERAARVVAYANGFNVEHLNGLRWAFSQTELRG